MAALESEAEEDYSEASFESPVSSTMARAAASSTQYDSNAILKPLAPDFYHIATNNYGLVLGDTSRPPKNLLEASSRRVAKHLEEHLRVQEEHRAASAASICETFTRLYTTALRKGDIKWASEQEVADLFHPEAKLITHDKQTHVGLTPILRRLNKGVENLMQMADRDGELSEEEAAKWLTVSDSKEIGDGVWVVAYTVRWGIQQFTFEDVFTLEQNKIKKLKRSRV